jgi:hypothetical protein
MNYDKKRKRQKDRQSNHAPKYSIWIDEYAQIHATIDKAIKEGILLPVDFDPSTLVTSFGGFRG